MELLHDGWPVHEARLREKVGDAQVEDWLRDGTLYYGEAEPLPPAFWERHQPRQIDPTRLEHAAQQASRVTPDPTLTVTPGKPPRNGGSGG